MQSTQSLRIIILSTRDKKEKKSIFSRKNSYTPIKRTNNLIKLFFSRQTLSKKKRPHYTFSSFFPNHQRTEITKKPNSSVSLYTIADSPPPPPLKQSSRLPTTVILVPCKTPRRSSLAAAAAARV